MTAFRVRPLMNQLDLSKWRNGNELNNLSDTGNCNELHSTPDKHSFNCSGCETSESPKELLMIWNLFEIQRDVTGCSSSSRNLRWVAHIYDSANVSRACQVSELVTILHLNGRDICGWQPASECIWTLIFVTTRSLAQIYGPLLTPKIFMRL